MARVAISPACCPPSQAGPSRSVCRVSLRRSSDLTVAAARSATVSPPPAARARAITTARSTARVGHRAATPVPRAAAARAWASSPAWASTRAVTHQAQPDREDQVTPGRPGMAQQPGIDGPHTGGFGARISEMHENTRMTPPMLISPMRAERTLKWPLMPTRNSTVARYTVVRT